MASGGANRTRPDYSKLIGKNVRYFTSDGAFRTGVLQNLISKDGEMVAVIARKSFIFFRKNAPSSENVQLWQIHESSFEQVTEDVSKISSLLWKPSFLRDAGSSSSKPEALQTKSKFNIGDEVVWMTHRLMESPVFGKVFLVRRDKVTGKFTAGVKFDDDTKNLPNYIGDGGDTGKGRNMVDFEELLKLDEWIRSQNLSGTHNMDTDSPSIPTKDSSLFRSNLNSIGRSSSWFRMFTSITRQQNNRKNQEIEKEDPITTTIPKPRSESLKSIPVPLQNTPKPSTSNAAKLPLQIRTLEGRTYKCEANTAWTVRQLKKEFERWKGDGTAAYCTLFYKAKRLADQERLSRYRIEPDGIIQANIRGTGGSNQNSS